MQTLKRLTMYISDSVYIEDEPLYKVLLRKAHALDLAGATVSRCVDGFGANTRLKKRSLLDSINPVAPLCIEIIDSLEYIEKLLPFIEEYVNKGIVIMEDVQVLKYARADNIKGKA